MSNVFNIIDELGLCAMDSICAFCLITMDGWNKYCPNCKNYKGVMALPDFINTYGKEMLPK